MPKTSHRKRKNNASADESDKRSSALIYMPIFGCWIADDYDEQGLSPIIVARYEGKRFAIAVFLCDFLCLGVKDAFIESHSSHARLNFILSEQPQSMYPVDYQEARDLILGSVEYASTLGILPHADYEKAKESIEPEKAYRYNKTLYGGKNGKPFYYAGPHDNVRSILEKLNSTVGPGNFDYIIDESLV